MPISSPLDIAGCQFWVDASQIVGLSDGDQIATWSDLSGNSRDAAQATSTKRFLYKTNIINGLPIARADGSDDLMVTSAFTLNQPCTVFAVIVQRTDPTMNKGILDGGGSAYTRYVYYPASGNTIGIYAGTTLGGPTIVTGTPYYLTAIFNGASSSIRVNGGTPSSGNAGSSAASGFTIGAAYNGASAEYGQTDFGEIFAYNSVLSAGDLSDVHNYLAAKWLGIGGGSSVPVKMASYRRRRAG
jgi:hypothetical protein